MPAAGAVHGKSTDVKVWVNICTAVCKAYLLGVILCRAYRVSRGKSIVMTKS